MAPPSHPLELTIANAMAAATTPRTLAAIVVDLLMQPARRPPPANAPAAPETAPVFFSPDQPPRVVWGIAAGWAPHIESPACLEPSSLALIQDLLDAPPPHAPPGTDPFQSFRPRRLSDGDVTVVAFGWTGDAALLLPCSDAQAQRWLDPIVPLLFLAAHHMDRLLELETLREATHRLEHSEKLQHALFAIADAAASDHDMDQVLRSIHRIIGTLMYAENFFIVLYDPSSQLVRFLYYADEIDPDPPDQTVQVPLDDFRHSLTWYLLTAARPMMGTTEQLRAQAPGPLKIIGPDSEDWLGVPMLHDGAARGALVVQNYRSGHCFAEKDKNLLEFVGSHILTALDRKHVKDDTERQVLARTHELAEANALLQSQVLERDRAGRLQAALFGIAQLVGSDISQDVFYQRTHQLVGTLTHADNFYIALLSEDATSLEFPYYVDSQQSHAPTRLLGYGLSEYVLRTGQPLLANAADIAALADSGSIHRTVLGPLPTYWLGVPLFAAGRALGLVAVQSYDQAIEYTQDDRELLVFVASQIANSLNRRLLDRASERAFAALEHRVNERTLALRHEIVERERIQEQLRHQVMHDPLTSLPNRMSMREKLTAALAHQQANPSSRIALLYLDIDRFKLINDSMGHLAGDTLLKEVATRLLRCVRSPDVVGRLAGDEFAVLLTEVASVHQAIAVANRIIEAVARPMTINDRQVDPSVSIGILMGDAQAHHHPDEMLHDADVAMYQAKQSGRNRFEVFDSATIQPVDVLGLESEIKQALRSHQFEPFFQPIVHLASGRVLGYEALIRWHHPTNGLLEPAAFLPIAESSGMIEQIDWHLFELAATAMARWTERWDPATPRPFLAINVSPNHLRHSDFDSRLLALLARSGMAPSQLTIEITEGSLLDNPSHVKRLLGRLRSAGVDAALDDFGTGYSSLGYLHSFPLRTLKIDRSFVSDLIDHPLSSSDPSAVAPSATGQVSSSEPVVTAILSMARALGMTVVAEGIETHEQREALRLLGCDAGQGYFLGRPAPLSHWSEIHAPSVSPIRATPPTDL